MVQVHVRYVGNGKQFFVGVPARDLTKEEFDGLDVGQQRDVENSDIYRLVRSQKKESSGSDSPSQESENN